MTQALQDQIAEAIAADREALAQDYERKAREYEADPMKYRAESSREMASLYKAVAKTIRHFPRATATPAPTGEPIL